MWNRLFALVALSLSLAGCSGMGGMPWPAGEPLRQEQGVQLGSLKVRVQGTYRAQTLDAATIRVLLEAFEGNGAAPRTQEQTLSAAGEARFTGLKPGQARLTVSLARGGRTLDQQIKAFNIQPGDNAFSFVLQDGTSALDLDLGNARVRLKDVRSEPGFEAMPSLGIEERWVFEQTLANDATRSVTYWNDSGILRYKLDEGYWQQPGSEAGEEEDPLTTVPDHAAVAPSEVPAWPANVRTWTWENDYPDPWDSEQVRTYRFKRWYSPTHGLLREDIYEARGGELVFVSRMTLKGW